MFETTARINANRKARGRPELTDRELRIMRAAMEAARTGTIRVLLDIINTADAGCDEMLDAVEALGEIDHASCDKALDQREAELTEAKEYRKTRGWLGATLDFADEHDLESA